MTPAPSPCEENGCTDIDNCDEICDHSRVYSPVQMREAAAKARNQTLDEFLECAFLPGIIHPDSEEGKFLKIIAKKLRTKEQP